MHLDLSLVQTFLAVVAHGSFSEAALRIGRTQAAVSQQIRRLEEQLGESLLVRTSRSMKLTHAGEVFVEHARQLIRLSNQARDAMKASAPRRCLRLGIVEEVVVYALPAALRRLKEEQPDLAFEIISGSTRELMPQLGARFDAVVGLRLAGQADRKAGLRLARLPMAWMGSWDGDKSRPVPLAVYPDGCVFRTQAASALDHAGMRWETAVIAGGAASIEATVRAGLALTVLPDRLSAADLPRIRGLPRLPSVEVEMLIDPGADDRAVLGLVTALKAELKARRQ